MAKQSYRAGIYIGYRRRGKKKGKKAKEEREEGTEEREQGKEGKLKEGNCRACAKAGLEHATVTTVPLGAHTVTMVLGRTLQ